MSHPLFSTKDVWAQTAEGFGPGFPQWIPTRSDDPSVFGTDVSSQFSGQSTFANTNAYVCAAVALIKDQDVSVGLSLLKVPNTGHINLYSEIDNQEGGGIICRLETHDAGVSLYASRIDANGNPSALPSIPRQRNRVAPFSLLPMYLTMVVALAYKFRSIRALVEKAQAADITTDEGKFDYGEAIIALSHAVYAYYDKGGVLTDFPGGNVPGFRGAPIPFDPTEGVILGPCRYLSGGATAVSAAAAVRKPRTFGEAYPMFAEWRNEAAKKWTEEEKDLIPSFPDDYPLPPETLKIANRYLQTRMKRRPMNNFLWRGITSYGKSTGVEMIAALLGTPLVRMTCSSTMETQNFLSEFVPDNTPAIDLTAIPSVEQMAMDPEGAWKELTGEEKEGVTANDCLQELLRRKASGSNNGARFKHVESNYVKALARGYICEIQEISRIRDPGVLVGLNEYDRSGAIVPLADGGYVRRDRNAMVIYTDNVGYASCRPVDPSVIRRMAFVLDSHTLPKTTVLSRVKYNTDFDDDALLERMYITWRKIQDYCAEHEITEGSVSVTELEMWAMCVDLAGGGASAAYDSCLECVVSKATSVISEQTEIMSACVDMALYN